MKFQMKIIVGVLEVSYVTPIRVETAPIRCS